MVGFVSSLFNGTVSVYGEEPDYNKLSNFTVSNSSDVIKASTVAGSDADY